MGICASTEYSERGQEEEVDEDVVYVADDDEEEDSADSEGSHGGARRLASLYSQKGRKGPNQDAIILCQGFAMEDGVFCGVFDGHGRSGHVVSRLVRDYLPVLVLSHHNAMLLSADDNDGAVSAFSGTGGFSSSSDGSLEASPVTAPPMFEEWKDACVGAFKAMDKELKLQSGLDCSFSGTTAVAIIKQGKDLIIANLGDSRAVMATMAKNGHVVAVQLTTDLKPSVPQEAERIREKEGRVFALRDEPRVARVFLPGENYPGLAMARSLGDFQLKRYGVISTPQVSYHRLTRRDLFIVLATDGVWDVLSNEEVVSIVRSTGSKQEASKAVVEAAVRTWKAKFPSARIDDCSAACLFLQEGRQPAQ